MTTSELTAALLVVLYHRRQSTAANDPARVSIGVALARHEIAANLIRVRWRDETMLEMLWDLGVVAGDVLDALEGLAADWRSDRWQSAANRSPE